MRILIAGVCLLTALVSACSDSGRPAAAQKVYRHAMDSAPSGLDPVQASNMYAGFLVTNLYDTLYRYKYLARPYELTPNLAAAMPEVSEDGLSYTIRLREGVHFIDDQAFEGGAGREVVAEDFIYSIKRHFDPKMRGQGSFLWQDRIVGLDQWREDGADYARPVEGLQALDRHRIQIRLTRPYPQLVHTLTQAFSALVPREAVEYYGRELAVHPVGSGPFKLVSFTSAKAVLDANPDYRGDVFDLEAEGFDEASHGFSGVAELAGQTAPFVDRMEVHFIQEDAARWSAFMGGELDYIRAPAQQFGAILASRDPIEPLPEIAERFNILTPMEAGFVHIDFNMDDPRIGYHEDPQQNERNRALRCAINQAFDWSARNESFYYGIGQTFPGIIPPVVEEFDATADDHYVGRDLDEARALLAEHGWTPDNLPPLEYGFQAGVTQRQMYEQFRAFMGDIGYPPEKIRALSYATFGDYVNAFMNRQVMVIFSGWNMDFPDAENTMQLFYGPNATPGSNSANYQNDEFDRLFRQAAVLPASPERTALYRQMNQLVLQDCPTISGLARTFVLMWDKRARIYPDRSFLGGYFARFADVEAVTP